MHYANEMTPRPLYYQWTTRSNYVRVYGSLPDFP